MKIVSVVLIVLLFLTTGCMRNIRALDEAERSQEGIRQTYNIDIDTAKAISKSILRNEGFEVIEDNVSYLNTTSLNTLFRVIFTSSFTSSGSRTEIWAISKRRQPTQIPTTLSESGFHARFAEALKKAGK